MFSLKTMTPMPFLHVLTMSNYSQYKVFHLLRNYIIKGWANNQAFEWIMVPIIQQVEHMDLDENDLLING